MCDNGRNTLDMGATDRRFGAETMSGANYLTSYRYVLLLDVEPPAQLDVDSIVKILAENQPGFRTRGSALDIDRLEHRLVVEELARKGTVRDFSVVLRSLEARHEWEGPGIKFEIGGAEGIRVIGTVLPHGLWTCSDVPFQRQFVEQLSDLAREYGAEARELAPDRVICLNGYRLWKEQVDTH